MKVAELPAGKDLITASPQTAFPMDNHMLTHADTTASRILSVATASTRAGNSAVPAHTRLPRVDYVELQRLLNADTLDYSAYDRKYAGGLLRYLETQLRSDVYLGAISWLKSRNHDLVFAWSERAGIPFAAYKRALGTSARFVTMFQCWSNRQERAIQTLDLFSAMDAIIVHCRSMKRNLIRLGVHAHQVHVIPYSIDQTFFAPSAALKPQRGRILSVGEPRSRDYPSLFQAVDGLPVELQVAASGHWYAREKKTDMPISVPHNVSISKRLPQAELRDLYASSQFIVLPIHNLVYSAGATAALEAASMGRAVIAFRSEGIVDYVIDGETGILVDPSDVPAMRQAIQYLLAHPEEAERLGQNARRRIEKELNLETYVCKIADLLLRNMPSRA